MSVATATDPSHPLDRQVRLTLQVAMAVFVWTIVIGILNGLDLMEFSRAQLLSHLHGGTLGWMTLAIIAVTMWLFTDSGARTSAPRSFSSIACVAIPLYVLAFATTTNVLRPIAGTLTLVALVGMAFWSYGRIASHVMTVPRLLVILGLTSSMIGGLFGVINGLAIAFEWEWVPESFFAAHPGTMEIGFVMPVALGLAEWGLRTGEAETKAGRLGGTQVALVAIAFVWALTFLLLGMDELVGPGLMFGIIAVVIFLVRMRRHIGSTSWMARAHGRHAVIGGILIAASFVYIFTIITVAQGDFEAIPEGRFVAFIHLMSIGGTTNALLAFVLRLVHRVSEPGILEDLIFWGINIGLIGFVLALTAGTRGLIAVFAPLMGFALLLAIGVLLPRLNRSPATT